MMNKRMSDLDSRMAPTAALPNLTDVTGAGRSIEHIYYDNYFRDQINYSSNVARVWMHDANLGGFQTWQTAKGTVVD